MNEVCLFLYWGNDAIHDLTKSGKAKLRIDLKKFNGEQGNVTYSTFKVRKISVGPTYMVVFTASFFTLSYTILLYIQYIHLMNHFLIMRYCRLQASLKSTSWQLADSKDHSAWVSCLLVLYVLYIELLYFLFIDTRTRLLNWRLISVFVGILST